MPAAAPDGARCAARRSSPRAGRRPEPRDRPGPARSPLTPPRCRSPRGSATSATTSPPLPNDSRSSLPIGRKPATLTSSRFPPAGQKGGSPARSGEPSASATPSPLDCRSQRGRPRLRRSGRGGGASPRRAGPGVVARRGSAGRRRGSRRRRGADEAAISPRMRMSAVLPVPFVHPPRAGRQAARQSSRRSPKRRRLAERREPLAGAPLAEALGDSLGWPRCAGR